ncbi:MAG: hypothetical protein QOH34_1586 [Mycobacterium sp.]|nr:hypothetical protein [Mycobacterium sp.]
MSNAPIVATCRSRWALPVAVIVGVPSLVILIGCLAAGSPLGALWGLVTLLAACAAVPFISIRVTAQAEGLTICFFPGWPTMTIPHDEILKAESVDVQAMSWGYRGSLHLFHRADIVLRSGPSLRLLLTNGRTLTITVDQPQMLISELSSR